MTAPDFNQLAAPRYAEGVRRLLGEDIQLPTVAPELAPEISLQTDRPEWQVLFGEIPVVGWRTDAAVVGQFSSVGADVSSLTRMLVITKVIIINQTAGVLVYRVGLIAPKVGLVDCAWTMARRDLR